MDLDFNALTLLALMAGFVWWKGHDILTGLRLRAMQELQRADLEKSLQENPFARRRSEAAPGCDHPPDEKTLRCFERLRALDESFDEEQFRSNGCLVYEAVVGAYASGDRELLQNYLAADVYRTFLRSIEAREERREHVELSFVRLTQADIVGAHVDKEQAEVSISFESEIVIATRDDSGNVVAGDATHVITTHDCWTFARGLNGPAPSWILTATGSPDRSEHFSRRAAQPSAGTSNVHDRKTPCGVAAREEGAAREINRAHH